MKIRILAISAAVCAMLLSCRGARESVYCGSMDISLSDSLLLTEESVKGTVTGGYGCCFGEVIDSIRLDRIESLVDSLPVVSKSEVWTTRDGVLHIRVHTHKPVIMLNREGVKMLCTAEGYLFEVAGYNGSGLKEIHGEFPFAPSCLDHGHLTTPEDAAWLSGLLDVVGREFDGTIEITSNRELKLNAAQGKEVFLFGQPVAIDDKFRRIGRYYEKIKPLGKEYSTVNLKYKGQTICRKGI